MSGKYWLAVTMAFHGLQYSYVQGEILRKCFGQYCGRVLQSSATNGSASSSLLCGACPWGYRTNGFICLKCSLDPSFYDWLFLGFMALLVPFLNCHMIEYLHKHDKRTFSLHLSVFLEFLLGCIISVIVTEPFGEMSLRFCGVHSIKDWYTIFFNPQTNYNRTVRCTQEAVYPLYTIVLLFYVLELLFLLLFRIPAYSYILHRKRVQRKSLYATLYILPILAVIHTIMAGVLYYTFPYILLIVSSLGTAVYLSLHSYSIWTKLKDGRTILILAMYALAHAYGIVAITQLKVLYRDGPLLLIIFIPSCFFLLTHKLTAPSKFCLY